MMVDLCFVAISYEPESIIKRAVFVFLLYTQTHILYYFDVLKLFSSPVRRAAQWIIVGPS